MRMSTAAKHGRYGRKNQSRKNAMPKYRAPKTIAGQRLLVTAHLGRIAAASFTFMLSLAILANTPFENGGASAQADVPAVTTERSASVASELSQKHGCWRGSEPQPEDVYFPGHAIISTADNPTPHRAGTAGVDAAMRQIFDGDHIPGLEVYAFCR